MDTTPEVVVEETPSEPTARFDVRKALKVAVITTAGVAAAVWVKRKLSADVDGELNLNVSTDTES